MKAARKLGFHIRGITSKHHIRIATWNVRTLFGTGKLAGTGGQRDEREASVQYFTVRQNKEGCGQCPMAGTGRL